MAAKAIATSSDNVKRAGDNLAWLSPPMLDKMVSVGKDKRAYFI